MLLKKEKKYQKIRESWALLPSFSGNKPVILPNKNICISLSFKNFERNHDPITIKKDLLTNESGDKKLETTKW